MNLNSTYTLSAATTPTITNNNTVSTTALAYANACTYDKTVKQTKCFSNDEIRENRIEFFRLMVSHSIHTAAKKTTRNYMHDIRKIINKNSLFELETTQKN